MSYATKAVERALAVANDDSVGYQWGGWEPEFDCGHLIIDAYERAGFPVKSHGGAASTHNMREAWLACGGCFHASATLSDPVLLGRHSHYAQVLYAQKESRSRAGAGRSGVECG